MNVNKARKQVVRDQKWTRVGFALLRKHGRDSSIVKPIKILNEESQESVR